MDIRDLGGALSYRRLRVILENLPVDSAFRQSMSGEAAWSVTDYLLANVIDLLAAANWQRGGDKHAPRPKRFPRPGERDGNTIGGNHSLPISDLRIWAARRKAGRDATG